MQKIIILSNASPVYGATFHRLSNLQTKIGSIWLIAKRVTYVSSLPSHPLQPPFLSIQHLPH